MGSCIGKVFLIALLAVLAVLLWHFLGRPETVGEAVDSAGDVLSRFEWDEFDFGEMFSNEGEMFSNEPTQGGGGENGAGGNNGDGLRWKQKNGLSLRLENNLDETWQAEFDEAVKNWGDSDPRIVSFETYSGREGSCAPRQGGNVMVVCSENSGDNGMLGINTIMFDDRGNIITSVASMNEYYLTNADWPARLYTMCHEIGHGLGLAHTDENPYNKDTGECMDYTDNPENNMFPGPSNFAILEDKYGTVVSRVRSRLLSASGDAGFGRRRDQQPASRQKQLAPHLLRSYEEAIVGIRRDAAAAASSPGRRGLKAPRGGTFSRHLLDGHSIKVQVLYVPSHY